jgi:hypothetical protein
LHAEAPVGPFFTRVTLDGLAAPPLSDWQTSAKLFSHKAYAVTIEPPDWLANPLTGQRVDSSKREWWQIPDFDQAVGDIKLIWELSRMDWVLALAQHARNGDEQSLSRMNNWLVDWCAHNRPYLGPNWKCGQEASIRVMHLAMAALILGQTKCTALGLQELVKLHLQRIAPTLQYAMAQDNNHGTSEAAAMYIGGSWLSSLGVIEGARWCRIGRRLLENRATRLIGANGTFSQYSLNYHRLMLDTFCMVEVWRRHMELPAFSICWQDRSRAAVLWLYHIINPHNGDGPNVGANDGARLLQLTHTSYRDFRPTVQLAMALFMNQRAYAEDGPWNDALCWLDVKMPQRLALQPCSQVFDDGGFAILRRGAAMVMLRYPRFLFRPSQADALHVDLWLEDRNLLRDAGSYSYNTDSHWLNYFSGTASHNTVQFDDRDQMPRISRFLFGDWLKTAHVAPLMESLETTQFGAEYSDGWRASHSRHVSLDDKCLRVIDKVAGFKEKAVLRWRVEPGKWRLEEQNLTNGEETLVVRASVPIVRLELVEGWEARNYLEKTLIPVLEIEVSKPCSLVSEFRWKND